MELVAFMINPTTPRERMSLSIPRVTRMLFRQSGSCAFRPVRNISTHRQETTWLITVATATPRMPQWNTNRNSGSRIRLITAPRMMVPMPTRG